MSFVNFQVGLKIVIKNKLSQFLLKFEIWNENFNFLKENMWNLNDFEDNFFLHSTVKLLF